MRSSVIGFICVCLCLSVACKRETRQFTAPPATNESYSVTMSEIHPGTTAPPPLQNAAGEQAYDVNTGKQLFMQYNCVGCHVNGGGGIGPPLMDAQWIYGSNPENIYSTIVEGRPNGMPSFRAKIPDSQVWQLVAYVRSLSGQLRKDVAPTRSDDMNAHRSEQRTKRETPKQSTPGEIH